METMSFKPLALYLAIFGSPPCTEDYHYCADATPIAWEEISHGPGHDDDKADGTRDRGREEPGENNGGDDADEGGGDDSGGDQGNAADCE